MKDIANNFNGKIELLKHKKIKNKYFFDKIKMKLSLLENILFSIFKMDGI